MTVFLCIIVTLLASGCGSSSLSTDANPTGPTGTMAPMPGPAPVLPSRGLLFTSSPIDPAAIQYIVALGALAPHGHTLPTDHIYFYHQLNMPMPFRAIPMTVPASGTIVGVSDFAGVGTRVDIRVDSEYQYWLGPVTLAPGLSVGSVVEAGTPLGATAGGPAFDFAVLKATLRLEYANRARYGRDTLTSDGPMKYFDEPTRAAIGPKVRRTGSDLDGKIDYDVPGTLAGNWFSEHLPVAKSGLGGGTTGLLKLSFARDVYQPDLQRVSMGGLGMTGLWAVPASAPRFDSVTPASGLVIYRLLYPGEPTGPPLDQQGGLLLVQLLDADRLRIEAVPTQAATAAFSGNAELYLR